LRRLQTSHSHVFSTFARNIPIFALVYHKFNFEYLYLAQDTLSESANG
jgi:hypothetical protein